MLSKDGTKSIRLVGSTADIATGPTDFDTIIVCAIEAETPTRYLSQIDEETFVMWIMPAPDKSSLTKEIAVNECENWVSTRLAQSLTLLFSVQKSNLAQRPQTFLLVATRERGLPKGSLILEAYESAALLESQQACVPRSRNLLKLTSTYLSWRTTKISLLVLLVISVLVTFVAFHVFRMDDIWIRYNTTGSKGPKYQLQFDHKNVTEWVAQGHLDEREWFLRIDDQAMIPAELLDEEEMRYQRWFQDRYPEMNQIRLEQAYVDPTFLSDPYSIQVPSDDTFHMAHCVRALRRYWQARETGRHVCPRDIDYRHMRHCLDALDAWAFVDGSRLSGGGMGQLNRTNIVLIWKTKVCW